MRLSIAMAVVTAGNVGATFAAEQFPNRPIRMLVPFSAGSQTDILARWIGEKMLENWGQQVVVDNRPSAGGTLASQYVLAANPDGHTLMMVSTGHAGNATLYSKLPYDTIKDFAGVSRVASVPNLLVVAPTLGPKSVKELIAYAKAKAGPGQLQLGGHRQRHADQRRDVQAGRGHRRDPRALQGRARGAQQRHRRQRRVLLLAGAGRRRARSRRARCWRSR